MPQTDPSTALVLPGSPAGSSLELAAPAWGLAQRIAGTDFVPKALRGKPEAVLACFLTGHELGIGPMQALAKIHVIEGRPAISAELMRALVLGHGHDLWIEEQSSERCIIAGKRRNSTRESRVTWTLDDARRAGLVGKDVWKKYPGAMLLARATGPLCRGVFADVLAGVSYTLEELEDGVLDDERPVELDSPAARGPAPAKKTARARQAATRGSDAPAETEPPPAAPAAHEEPPLPGEDDDVVDAEIVGEDDYEGPDQHIEGRAYSPTQVLAIRAGELGLDRQEKLDLCSSIIGRGIDSTKDLEPAEVKTILEAMAADGFDARAILDGAPATSPEAAESAPSGPPRRRRAAEPAEAAPGPSRGPVGTWKAEDWRAFLAERGVKVTEVLKEAAKLARESDLAAPGNLDELIGHELEAVLVGFVEDLALRGRA